MGNLLKCFHCKCDNYFFEVEIDDTSDFKNQKIELVNFNEPIYGWAICNNCKRKMKIFFSDEKIPDNIFLCKRCFKTDFHSYKSKYFEYFICKECGNIIIESNYGGETLFFNLNRDNIIEDRELLTHIFSSCSNKRESMYLLKLYNQIWNKREIYIGKDEYEEEFYKWQDKILSEMTINKLNFLIFLLLHCGQSEESLYDKIFAENIYFQEDKNKELEEYSKYIFDKYQDVNKYKRRDLKNINNYIEGLINEK